MSRDINKLAEERLTTDVPELNKRRSPAIFVTIGSLVILAAAALLVMAGHVFVPVACIVVAATGMATSFRMLRKSESETSRELDEVTGITVTQGEFLAGFSHRIREPLNNLVILGDLISATGLTPKQKDLVETLIASTNNMVSTVNELTMQGAGSAALGKRKPIRFSVTAAIQNTIELFNLSAPSSVSFTIDTPGEPETTVSGDPIVIKQILLDVLNSSVQQPGASLRIVVERSVEAGNRVTISISIYSAFRLLKEKEEGELPALAERLVEDYGGSCSYSVADGTYCFSFSIPFRISEERPVRQSLGSRKIAELSREEPKRKKELNELNLLLVEDNVINQRITFLTLSPLVKNIDTASNGKEALDKVATSDYDIILMDIQMPVMDGLVAAEKIRALEKSSGKHVPIIAITANAMLGDKEKCISAGMDDYISKPFQPSSLIEKIKVFF